MTAQGELQSYGIQATTTVRLCFSHNSPPIGSLVFNMAGPEHVEIAVLDCGVLIFDFSKSKNYSGGKVSEYKLEPGNRVPRSAEKEMETRNKIRNMRAIYVNAFLACFNSVVQSNTLTPPMTQENYIIASNVSGRVELHGYVHPLHPISYVCEPVQYQMLAEVQRLSIDAYLRVPELSYDLLEMLYRASFQCTQHDFQGSLALSWVVIEKIQNVLWKRFVMGGYKAINPNTNIIGKRKEYLLTDHNYTASIKTQILSLTGIYTDQEMIAINDIRSARNKLMHNLARVDDRKAMDAASCAMSMVSRVLHERIHFQAGPVSWDRA